MLLVGGHSTAHPHPLLPAGWPQGSDDWAEEAQTENRSVRDFLKQNAIICLSQKSSVADLDPNPDPDPSYHQAK